MNVKRTMTREGLYAAVGLEGECIIRPFVRGCYSEEIPRRPNGDTHRWKLYIRSINNDDMSGYIKSVQFKLNEGYAPRVRIVTSPPWEIVETGYEEFDVKIKLCLQSKNEKAMFFTHTVRLFPDGPRVLGAVVNEVYDEFIFLNPSKSMRRCLEIPRPMATQYRFRTDFNKEYMKQLKEIENGHERMRHQLEELAKKLYKTKQILEKFQQEVFKEKSQ